MIETTRLLYKGTLRVLLVLLHDFPEFLCDYHFSFCDVIPPSCIQLRNLILSAFPRNMRLPDPFTPNLKVDLLPEISQSPRVLSDYASALVANNLKNDIDNYLKTRSPISFPSDLKQKLLLDYFTTNRLKVQIHLHIVHQWISSNNCLSIWIQKVSFIWTNRANYLFYMLNHTYIYMK
jgi:hypothetical protein